MKIIFLLFATLITPLAALAGMPAFAPDILAQTARVYAPDAAALGLPLKIEILHGSSLVVASADRDLREVRVVIHEGLLTSPRLTADGFRMILCHELGHIFGGEPRRPNPPEFEGPSAPDGLSLLSAEGQSDFYASACFRRLMTGETHILSPKSSARAQARCETVWGARSTEALICRRAAQAALDFLNLVREFPISLDREDGSVVTRTLTAEYPPRQCRLDTMVAAALGAERPACWFRK